MARLSQSQLAGFRIGTDTQAAAEPTRPEPRRKPPRDPHPSPVELPPAAQPAPSTPANTTNPLGPIPNAPGRGEPRHKVGLTLPLDLAQRVRDLTNQGYGLADIVMVAYQNHRDRLLDGHRVTNPRQLVRRASGRSPLTVALSSDERAALDALAQHLGGTRSHTVAKLLAHQLEVPSPDDQ
jgi:hypothetical protein